MNTKILVEIAKDAGAKALEIYHTHDLGIEYKKDDSPLTRADLAANKVINEGLKRYFPEIPILSEENDEISFETRKNWNEFFLVDPIDGTKEFIKKGGDFTINIAYCVGNHVVDGVVFAPAKDLLYYTDGANSFVEENNTKSQIPCEKPAKYTVVASKSHMNDETRNYLDSLGDIETLQIGSSLKICMIAHGRANEYPRLGPTMEWDTAAAHAVLKKAGGNLVDFKTREELGYNKENLLNPYFLGK